MSDEVQIEANAGHPAVVVAGLGKSHGGRALWSNVSFRVEHGGSLAITGPSGAGKSTLLHCVSRLERCDSGSIEIDGAPVGAMSGSQLRALRSRTLGHLFQDYALVESWTVRRNLDVALIGERVKRQDRTRRHSDALARVGLAEFLERRISTLSGGEQQRVALARLLVRRPAVILADEPSAALDDARVEVVLDVLGELRASGAAILVATHDPRVIDWCGERLHLDSP